MSSPAPHEEQVLGKAYDARLMRRLLRYIKPYRKSASIAVAFIIAAAIVGVLPPYLTKIAIDRYIETKDLAGLHWIAALYVCVLLGEFALSYGQTWVMNMMGQRVMFDLRMEIFSRLQKMD